MADADLMRRLWRCKSDLEQEPDEEKLIEILGKLRKLPVTISALQETGIGRIINSYRKHEGVVGELARCVVSSWKLAVEKEVKKSRNRSPSPSGSNDKSENEEEEMKPIKTEEESDTDSWNSFKDEDRSSQASSNGHAETEPESSRKRKINSESERMARVSHGTIKEEKERGYSAEEYTLSQKKYRVDDSDKSRSHSKANDASKVSFHAESQKLHEDRHSSRSRSHKRHHSGSPGHSDRKNTGSDNHRVSEKRTDNGLHAEINRKKMCHNVSASEDEENDEVSDGVGNINTNSSMSSRAHKDSSSQSSNKLKASSGSHKQSPSSSHLHKHSSSSDRHKHSSSSIPQKNSSSDHKHSSSSSSSVSDRHKHSSSSSSQKNSSSSDRHKHSSSSSHSKHPSSKTASGSLEEMQQKGTTANFSTHESARRSLSPAPISPSNIESSKNGSSSTSKTQLNSLSPEFSHSSHKHTNHISSSHEKSASGFKKDGSHRSSDHHESKSSHGKHKPRSSSSGTIVALSSSSSLKEKSSSSNDKIPDHSSKQRQSSDHHSSSNRKSDKNQHHSQSNSASNDNDKSYSVSSMDQSENRVSKSSTDISNKELDQQSKGQNVLNNEIRNNKMSSSKYSTEQSGSKVSSHKRSKQKKTFEEPEFDLFTDAIQIKKEPCSPVRRSKDLKSEPSRSKKTSPSPTSDLSPHHSVSDYRITSVSRSNNKHLSKSFIDNIKKEKDDGFQGINDKYSSKNTISKDNIKKEKDDDYAKTDDKNSSKNITFKNDIKKEKIDEYENKLSTKNVVYKDTIKREKDDDSERTSDRYATKNIKKEKDDSSERTDDEYPAKSKHLKTNEKEKDEDSDSIQESKKDKHKREKKKGVATKNSESNLKDESEMSFEDFMTFDEAFLVKKGRSSQKSVPAKPASSSSSKEKLVDKPPASKWTSSLVTRSSSDASFAVPTPTRDVTVTEKDILSMLPETQAFYKPLRYNPYLKDEEKEPSPPPMIDPDLIGTKSIGRTHVYSGRKHGVTELKSLYDMCLQVLIENIDAIDYVGGIPYSILKPVLERCTAQQLYQLEDYNPHFLEDTNELWEILSQREFRGREPGELESWRELYMRLFEERELKFQKLKQTVSSSIVKGQAGRKAQLAYVDTVAKPPRDVLRKQKQFGTGCIVRTKGNPNIKGSSSGLKAYRPSTLMPAHNPMNDRPRVIKPLPPMMAKSLQMRKNLRR